MECLSFRGFDEQDHILFAARANDGSDIAPSVVRRLFEMPGRMVKDRIRIDRADLVSILTTPFSIPNVESTLLHTSHTEVFRDRFLNSQNPAEFVYRD